MPRPDQRYSGGSAADDAARDLFNLDEHADLDPDVFELCWAVATAGVPEGAAPIACRSVASMRCHRRARARRARRPRTPSSGDDDGEPEAAAIARAL